MALLALSWFRNNCMGPRSTFTSLVCTLVISRRLAGGMWYSSHRLDFASRSTRVHQGHQEGMYDWRFRAHRIAGELPDPWVRMVATVKEALHMWQLTRTVWRGQFDRLKKSRIEINKPDVLWFIMALTACARIVFYFALDISKGLF